MILLAQTKIICGDCLVEMGKFADGEFQLAITSPPYNLDISYHSYRDRLPQDKYLEWTAAWMKEIARVLHNDGSFFLNVSGSPSSPWIPFDVANEARKIGFILQNRILWVKSIHIDDVGHTYGHVKPINSDRFLNGTHEFIFHFTKNGKVPLMRYEEGVGVPFSHPSNLKRWNHSRTRACGGNTWHIPYQTIQNKEERGGHPATYPVELPLKCLRLAGAEPGWKALDPFGGVGTTAVACRQLGVEATIIELDKTYCEYAEKRIFALDSIASN